MNGTAQYLHFGFILISVANLIVIALLILIFLFAVAFRRPAEQRISTIEAEPEQVVPDTQTQIGETIRS